MTATSPPNLKSLFQAVLAAQREAKSVVKDGRNAHFDFDYTKADTMYRTGKEILNRHGLVLMPLGLESVQHQKSQIMVAPTGRTVVEVTHYDVRRTFVLGHESGESVTFSIDWPVDLANDKKSRDKSQAAACTTLLGYSYRDLLALGRLAAGEVDQFGSAPSLGALSATDAEVKAELRADAEARDTPPVPDRSFPFGENARKAEQEREELARRAESQAARSATADAMEVSQPLLPGADDLEGCGWPRDTAEEIVQLGMGPECLLPVPRLVVNHLCKLATTSLSLKGKAAKAHLVTTFHAIGVDVVKKAVPTGVQLCHWAALALNTEEI